MKFWPRTLVVQLIVVTAAAVVISNIAVALWFERGNERQTEIAAERARAGPRRRRRHHLERHSAQRRATCVMRTMSSRVWQFTEIPCRRTASASRWTTEETRLAQASGRMLPPQARVGRVAVSLHEPLQRHSRAHCCPQSRSTSAIAMPALIMPLDASNTMIDGLPARPPGPGRWKSSSRRWSAILVASAARRLDRAPRGAAAFGADRGGRVRGGARRHGPPCR